MSKLMVEPALRDRLKDSHESLELTDENGRTFGMYLPAEHYERLLYRLAESQCPYTPDQLDQMRQEPGDKTLADFRKRIGQP